MIKPEKFESYWKRIVGVVLVLDGKEPKSLQVKCNATTDEFELNIEFYQKVKEKKKEEEQEEEEE